MNAFLSFRRNVSKYVADVTPAHRLNDPMGPMGRVSSSFRDYRECGCPPTVTTGCHFRWALLETYSASPDIFAKFKGRKTEE